MGLQDQCLTLWSIWKCCIILNTRAGQHSEFPFPRGFRPFRNSLLSQTGMKSRNFKIYHNMEFLKNVEKHLMTRLKHFISIRSKSVGLTFIVYYHFIIWSHIPFVKVKTKLFISFPQKFQRNLYGPMTCFGCVKLAFSYRKLFCWQTFNQLC